MIRLSYIAQICTIALTLALGSCSSSGSASSKDGQAGAGEDNHPEPLAVAVITPEQMKAIGIDFGHIEYKDLTSTIRALGFLRVPMNHRAKATPLYPGVIESLRVQMGDVVRKGQAIATIGSPELIKLQEDYLACSADLRQAEQELQRQRTLASGKAGTGRNLEQAETTLRTLQARSSSLGSQLRLVGISPSSLSPESIRPVITLTSPINGTVSNIYVSIGAFVDGSSPVIEVVDNSALHLDLRVFERDLPKVAVGQTIHFTLTNNPTSEYDAVVYSIGSAFEDESKSIAVHCRVEGDKQGLIDGMNITGVVSLGTELKPVVPVGAIVEADGKDYIIVETALPSEADGHDHEAEGHTHQGEHNHAHEGARAFRKVEVARGVTELGYTAIVPVEELPQEAVIITKGAFFVYAKLSGSVAHNH